MLIFPFRTANYLVVNGASLSQSAPLYKSVVPVSHFAIGVAIY